LLSFIAGGKSILQARKFRLASPENAPTLLEVIDVSIRIPEGALFPFVEKLTPVQRMEHLAVIFPQSDRSLEQGLKICSTAPNSRLMAWTPSCRVTTIGEAAKSRTARSG
jgi:hypothetical protein